jgi:starch phosphorylase
MSGATGLEQKIKELTNNLWWTWHPEAIDVWRNIDPVLWRETRHSPIAFVRQLSKDRLEALNEDPSFRIKIHRVLSDLQRYRDSSATWGGIHARQLRTRPVAYFCAEFGIHESLPLYSGGLGVLAGDHLKSASDLGIPMVGVSLFYRNGYFRQRISEAGEQIADDEEVNPEDLPLVRVQDAQGRPVVIDLPIQGDTVQISAWTVPLGRIRLYFLDMEEAFRALGFQDLGSRLYGGDEAVRLSQEMILGIGGMR